MFYIPNDADAPHAPQAQVDSRDWDIVALAFGETWVIDGCLVSAQGVPNMTIAVAAGTVRINGTQHPVTAAPSLAVGVADATLGRFDLVVVNTVGVASIVAGTANAVPAFPVIPADRAVLAAIYVLPSATMITADEIIDKRIFSTLHVHEVGDPPVPGVGVSRSGELAGTIDGVNKVFGIPEDYQIGSFALYVGGIMVRPSTWSLSGPASRTVVIGATVPAPQVGEWVGGTWDI